MTIKELLKKEMGEAIDWLIENQDHFEIIEKQNPCRHCGGETREKSWYCIDCGKAQ